MKVWGTYAWGRGRGGEGVYNLQKGTSYGLARTISLCGATNRVCKCLKKFLLSLVGYEWDEEDMDLTGTGNCRGSFGV